MNFPGNGQQVQSKEDFVRFLSELRINLSEHPAEWENRSLESYLEAMEAWLADSSADSSEPSWGTLAELLLAARIYE
ncbi:DUF7660 family protein [Paenibacillus mucilaginosus]|uniref:DUF7660 domain-containing protein n=1 Tax=Paenibacillus mucilaginosus (strain KNP414) TaxID=1036673 RepID=F8F802_PAEMK|nr:hypothetical protein [Paenibacillus mucilaginosus]AEI40987.1 hypothetical protein KNP414_02426 [Paenibacillus mucilaginosus KNP414]MCG7211567.1 hypothetical protein [Paenibacillus mucilaginosus]WDM30063.1 hypothetical protein KCX80_13355 [Paenibacillus mucilaginosus]